MTEHAAATDGKACVSTKLVPAGERAALWVDMVCRHLIEVECEPVGAGASFHGAIALRTVGVVDVSQIASCPQQVTRTGPLLAQANDDYFLLNIQRQGRSIVCQDGREATLAPGDMTLYSSARRYRLGFETDFEQTVLVLPAAPLRALSPGIDGLTATTLDRAHPLAALLLLTADSHFHTAFETLPGQVATHAGNALIETVAGCLAALPGQAGKTRSNLSLFHLNRIRQYALAHLGDTTLSVAQVAAALKMSPSHVHRLFAHEAQTFSAWLWEYRLQACAVALRQPGHAHLSIGQIADRNGFAHAVHFSRTFRARFGITARDWRATQSKDLPGRLAVRRFNKPQWPARSFRISTVHASNTNNL